MRARRRGLIVRRTASTSRPCVKEKSLPTRFARGSMHGVLDAFVERVENFFLGAGARRHGEIDIE